MTDFVVFWGELYIPGLRAVASGVSVALGKTKQKAPLHEVAHGTHSWSRVGSKVRLMYSPTSHAERRGVHASCRNSGLRLCALAELQGALGRVETWRERSA